MKLLDQHAVRSWHVGDGTLASLEDTSLAGLFHAWRGRSEHRYLMSVYRIDPDAPGAGLPDFDAFVLLSIALDGRGRRPVGITAIERGSDKRFAIRDALAGGAIEWHVHLLGADRADRAAIVADLRARHSANGSAAISA